MFVVLTVNFAKTFKFHFAIRTFKYIVLGILLMIKRLLTSGVRDSVVT